LLFVPLVLMLQDMDYCGWFAAPAPTGATREEMLWQ
jgi:hypothetical protein